ncbi:MAG: hypothetical protein H0T51_06385 [Pirellulales bacterium]|nr:hypothetical protein [Pirellulales bacterium]
MKHAQTSNTDRPRIDPPHLIIPSKTALPKRCIVTNEPVSDSEYQVWDLPCIPRWLIALMFMGIFFLLTGPYVRHRCKVKAGLSKRARRNRRLKRLLLLLVVFSPLFVASAAIAAMSPHWLLPGLISVMAAYFTIPYMVLTSQPLRVRQSRDGLHWVDGCSPAFLASLEEEPILELVEASVE